MFPRHLSREIDDLTADLVTRLTAAMEVAVDARVRVLTEESLRAAALQSRAERPSLAALPKSPKVRAARRATPVVTAPAVVDPEQQRRDAELARVRAILQPVAPPVTRTAPPVESPAPRTKEGNGPLQALEDLIRDQVPALTGLSQSRSTARIATWVGQVRLVQSGPDAERTRVAARMLLDKLRALAWSMDAGTIEGLDASWSTRNWQRYIEANEVIADTPDAAPAPAPEPSPEAAADAAVWSTPG